jgi:hypothetical protein
MNTSMVCAPFDRSRECDGRREAAGKFVELFKGSGQ